MGGSNTQTTKTGPTSEIVSGAIDDLASAYRGQIGNDAPFFDRSTYVPAGIDTLQGAQGVINTAHAGKSGLSDAFGYARGVVGNQGYNQALRSAQGGIENYLSESQANAPGYERLRSRISDDTLTGINSTFSNSGRLGSGEHLRSASSGLADSLAGLDYRNYTDRLGRQFAGNQALAGLGQTAMGNAMGAAQSIPGLYQATQRPNLDRLSAGSIIDSNQNAIRQGEYDLYNRRTGADLDWLNRISSGITGTAGAGGTTSTTTFPQPSIFQTLLGGGLGLAGFFGR